ncbi:MAG: hypothetical protein J5875_11360 [Paludibacteraceae bacterium]|nr:hypothetical protein [Paludibacteraceae bacterium]
MGGVIFFLLLFLAFLAVAMLLLTFMYVLARLFGLMVAWKYTGAEKEQRVRRGTEISFAWLLVFSDLAVYLLYSTSSFANLIGFPILLLLAMLAFHAFCYYRFTKKPGSSLLKKVLVMALPFSLLLFVVGIVIYILVIAVALLFRSHHYPGGCEVDTPTELPADTIGVNRGG